VIITLHKLFGMGSLLFSSFEVSTQAFYRATRSFAIVNLKPIVPGHVLVIPNRPVPRLADLDDYELGCLMRSLKRVGSVVQTAYGGDGLTIACQDGKAAGQTVPHVHFHVLPRKFLGDPFSKNNDEIYPALEENEGSLRSELLLLRRPSREQPLHVDADEDGKPRTREEMEREAIWLKGFFTATEQTEGQAV